MHGLRYWKEPKAQWNVKCPKHHVFMIWKETSIPGSHYAPVRVCPMCVKLARLTVRKIRHLSP